MRARLLLLSAVVLAGCAPLAPERPVPLSPSTELQKQREPECSRQFDADEAGFQTCLEQE